MILPAVCVVFICFAILPAWAGSSALTNGLDASATFSSLEAINGTLNYRIYGKKGKDEKPWFDGRGLDMRHIHCVRKGKCEKLSNRTCLGVKLPYETSSVDLTDYQYQHEVWERLENYRALRHVPKCWAVIQVGF